jgi:hypothetical protein
VNYTYLFRLILTTFDFLSLIVGWSMSVKSTLLITFYSYYIEHCLMICWGLGCPAWKVWKQAHEVYEEHPANPRLHYFMMGILFIYISNHLAFHVCSSCWMLRHIVVGIRSLWNPVSPCLMATAVHLLLAQCIIALKHHLGSGSPVVPSVKSPQFGKLWASHILTC